MHGVFNEHAHYTTQAQHLSPKNTPFYHFKCTLLTHHQTFGETTNTPHPTNHHKNSHAVMLSGYIYLKSGVLSD